MSTTINEVDKIMAPKIIKCGYLFDKNYQLELQLDVEVGMIERKILIKTVEEALFRVLKEYNGSVIERGNNLTLQLILDDQELLINVDTVNSLVTQNKDRKINNKSYLPFDKNMDKFNSVYVSVATDNITDDSYEIADTVLAKIVSLINEPEDKFIYKSLVVKSPIE